MDLIKSLVLVLSAAAAAILTACATGGSGIGSDSMVTEATVKQISGDVPLPPGAVIKQQDTLVMGSANNWLGRIGMSVSGEPQGIFTYFKDGMTAAGWALTSSSFSKTSLLTFTKSDRVANIQVQAANFGGNDVLITVAPSLRVVPTRP